MNTYKFQCPKCYIVSGNVSVRKEDAPTCCGGENMQAILISTSTYDDKLTNEEIQEMQDAAFDAGIGYGG